MSRYRLTYFNGRGRCETIRLVFAAAGIGYEDRRIDAAEWTNMKPHTQWGTLPILEFDGNEIGQSITIARFIAKESGLAGKGNYEQALVDSVVDAVTEFRERTHRLVFAYDSSEKNRAIRDFEEKMCPSVIPNLDKFLSRNPYNSGYFVGEKMTLADIHFYSTIENLLPNMPDVLARHPRLQQLYDRIESDPRISEYLRRRPLTSF